MKLHCTHCKKHFEPDAKGAVWFAAATAKGMTFIMLDCTRCGWATGINPQDGKAPARERAKMVRCPVSACTGWAMRLTHDQGMPYGTWACGECGSVWIKQAALDAEIERQVARRAHRKAAYVRDGKTWRRSKREPRDYESKVEREKRDKAKE